MREFGVAVPAFRVCVNTGSVQGSIGYSTNLFPAMTLGCGALGGNITSDNIGPQHLMNLRRVAWESRAIEHRSIPAAQRMARPDAAAPRTSRCGSIGRQRRHSCRCGQISNSKSAVRLRSISSGGSGLFVAISAGIPDRAVIAHAVEHVMAHLGIARGAACILRRKSRGPTCRSRQSRPPQKPFRARHSVSPFVTEGDVRRAVTRGEKIFIGPKTILTPSARDVAGSEDVLVVTDLVPKSACLILLGISAFSLDEVFRFLPEGAKDHWLPALQNVSLRRSFTRILRPS